MHRFWNKIRGKCEHPNTLVVSSVGVRRSVCSSCGHISFRMTSGKAPRQGSNRPPIKKAAGL